MDLEGISIVLRLGCPAGMDFHSFLMDLHRFGRHFNDSGAWVLLDAGIRCGALWRPVAGCGGLWQKAVAPIYYHARSLGLAGW